MRIQSICLALAIFLICSFTSAQWVKTSLPHSVSVRCLSISGTNVFAATADSGVFRSSDNGASWTAVNEGLPRSVSGSITYFDIKCILTVGQNLFAGTGSGVFLSTNNGSNWTEMGLTNTLVYCLAISGTSLFAGAAGVFLSTDNGTKWTPVSEGLPKGGKGSWYPRIESLASSRTNLFAAAYSHLSGQLGGVFLSTNSGANWITLTDRGAGALAVSGTNLFAGMGDSVFLSTNNGSNWTAVNGPFLGLSEMVQIDTYLFAGSGNGVFLTNNNGTSWIQVNAGLTDTSVSALAVCGTNLYAGTGSGVWRRPMSELVSVRLGSGVLPTQFIFDQNYPNPFNPSTTIKFELPKSSDVRLSVFDMLGREVSVLVNERRDAGVYEVKFDASKLASGVYLYRLQAGDFVQSRKMLVLR